MKLYDIAHARAGGKGHLDTVSLIPYDDESWPLLCEHVTTERVAAHPGTSVERYEMPNVRALIFVCARRDTPSTSLRRDAHGRSLSSLLLELEI